MQYNFRGSYDPVQNYSVKDVISYTQNGVTKYYFCLNPVFNTNPQQPNPSSDSFYWGVINTLSNFPNSIDDFIFRVNISGNDKIDITRINELTLKTTLTSDEQDELNNLIAKHRNKLFQAEDLNAIQDALSNLQMFFKDKIESYINSSITDIQTTRDNALNDLETKKASLDLYLDSTDAGALRVDLGVMGDLTTTDKSSLVKAINETRASAQVYKLTADDGKVKTLVSSIDLNTVKGTGFYYSAGTNINSPFAEGGTLEVFAYGTGASERVLQRYSKNSTTETWERVYTGSAWGGWTKLASNVEAQMKKITSDTGGAKLSANSSTDDILSIIASAGIGMHTIYAIGTSLNLPNSSSIRGFAHITQTSPLVGYVQAYDDQGNSFTNLVINAVWKGWHRLVADNDIQNELWSGYSYVDLDSQGDPRVIAPTKKLSECRNGWILVWSDYDPGVGFNEFDFDYTYIPKAILTRNIGAGHVFPIGNSLSNTSVGVIVKKLRIYDDKLTGYAENNSSSTGTNDVTLRYIFEW